MSLSLEKRNHALLLSIFVPDDGNVFSILYLGRNGSDTCSDTLHVSLRPAVIPSASIHAPVKCVPAAAG